jgi:hypothetical protein
LASNQRLTLSRFIRWVLIAVVVFCLIATLLYVLGSSSG